MYATIQQDMSYIYIYKVSADRGVEAHTRCSASDLSDRGEQAIAGAAAAAPWPVALCYSCAG